MPKHDLISDLTRLRSKLRSNAFTLVTDGYFTSEELERTHRKLNLAIEIVSLLDDAFYDDLEKAALSGKAKPVKLPF